MRKSLPTYVLLYQNNWYSQLCKYKLSLMWISKMTGIVVLATGFQNNWYSLIHISIDVEYKHK